MQKTAFISTYAQLADDLEGLGNTLTAPPSSLSGFGSPPPLVPVRKRSRTARRGKLAHALRTLDQRPDSPLDPVLVLAGFEIFKQPPVLGMFRGFARLENAQRPQGLKFEKLRSSKHLAIASKIRIRRSPDWAALLDEQTAFSEVGAPSSRIMDPDHLLLEPSVRIALLPQLNVPCADLPAGIGKIGIAPGGNDSFGEQSMGGKRGTGRERQDGRTAAGHR